MLEKRTAGTDGSAATLVRYIYSNHLSTASLELDDTAAIISYEEYHPYGTTSYQAKSATINAVAKRYRFTGKERDEETGLYYFGGRYYAPWLTKWMAVDPLDNKNIPKSSYGYCSGNPISRMDKDGKDDISFNTYIYSVRDQSGRIVDAKVMKWVTVTQNDKPNTYHVNNYRFEINNNTHKFTKDEKQFYPESWGSTGIISSDYLFGLATLKDDDRRSMLKMIHEFPAVKQVYANEIYSNKPQANQSQSQKNSAIMRDFITASNQYFKNKEEEEAVQEMMFGIVTFVGGEYLMAKIARYSEALLCWRRVSNAKNRGICKSK